MCDMQSKGQCIMKGVNYLITQEIVTGELAYFKCMCDAVLS